MAGVVTRHRVVGTATIGEVHMELFPYRFEQTDVDGGIEWPWALGGLTRVRFQIGELSVSKRLTQKFSWQSIPDRRPSDTEIRSAWDAVLDNLRTELSRMGIDSGRLVPRNKVEDFLSGEAR